MSALVLEAERALSNNRNCLIYHASYGVVNVIKPFCKGLSHNLGLCANVTLKLFVLTGLLIKLAWSA